MSYRIIGLDPAPFVHLYGLPEAELATHGVLRYRVTASPGFPDRVELRDLDPGESALLLNFEHQPAATPYRASHAIFVREGADRPAEVVDAIPDVLRRRPLSIRAFDASHMMVDADLVDGVSADVLISRMLDDPRVAYLQAHYAKRGCYAARIERA